VDSKIWTKESDRYTSRAIKSHEGKLYSVDESYSEKISDCISTYTNNPKKILDVGCAYGRVISHLKGQFKEACFYGIDPGAESVKIGNSNLGGNRVQFKQGYSHDLTYSDNMFDVVIFSMVLQWLPRNKLIKTISEVDRVLRTGGVVFIQDFLPNRSVTSQSRHDDEIYIFKDDYAKFFTSFPWFKEVYREVSLINDGEDQQRNISIIKKYNISDVYLLKAGALER